MPYLEIKKTRLNSRLIVKFHIEPQTYVWFISHLLLQYLVKDLIKYIIAWSPNGSLMQATKKSQYSYLQTEVANNNYIQHTRYEAKNKTVFCQNGEGRPRFIARLNVRYPNNHNSNIIRNLNLGNQVQISVPMEHL
jgi:LytS/YehU family sensor histidine kinase